jgi:hypothetical protein
MLLVPARPSLSLLAFFDLWKAMIQVKAHTRKDGTQVKAHTRNIQSRAERKELVAALARKMADGAHTRHATLASAVGAARYASKANGKAVHVYEHAEGGWVATHDASHTEGHDEKIVAHKGKARLHRAGEASRSLAHLKGPIAEHVAKPAPAPKVKPARPKAEKKPAPEATPKRYTYGLQMRPPSIGAVPKDYVGLEPPNEHFRHGLIHYDRELTPEEVKSYELDHLTSKGRSQAREDMKASNVFLGTEPMKITAEHLDATLDMAKEDNPGAFDEALEHLKERRPDLAGAIAAWEKKAGGAPEPAQGDAPAETAMARGWPGAAAQDNGKAGKPVHPSTLAAGDMLMGQHPGGQFQTLVVLADPTVKPEGQFVIENEDGRQLRVDGGFFKRPGISWTHAGQAYPEATPQAAGQDSQVRAIVERSGGTLLSGPSPKVRTPKYDKLATDKSGRFHIYDQRLALVGRERPNLLSKKAEAFGSADVPYVKADPKAMRMVSEVAFFPATASDKAHKLQGITALSDGTMVNTGHLQALRSAFPDATLHVLPPGDPLAGNAYTTMVYAIGRMGELVGFMGSVGAEEPHLRQLSAALKGATTSRPAPVAR